MRQVSNVQMAGLINIVGGLILVAFSVYMLLDVLYFDPVHQYSFPLGIQAMFYASWTATLIVGLVIIWFGYSRKLKGIE